MGNLFGNLRFVIPFALNQLASLLNNVLLAGHNMSVVVPSVNCVSFIVTFITQKLLKGESLIDLRFFSGVSLIVVGLFLCLSSHSN